LDPSEAQFRAIFMSLSAKMKLACSGEVIDYLIEKHYKGANRGLRFCHPRDLLRQIANFCSFHETRGEVTRENVDAAVRNYFAAIAVAQ
ncbi:MAG: AAA family ATPase, partial [Planctomycetales bacterium]|nr:AAA family ATPase [Planctomycetales bacterium]